MLCTTTTTTTQPCRSPFPPSDLDALVPNPETMTTCEEIVKGIVEFREKVLEFWQWFLKSDATLSDGALCVVCAMNCEPTELNESRWEMPCTSGGTNLICPCTNPDDKTRYIGTEDTILYSVVLRFRGLVEPKSYTGGSNDGAWFQTGGTPDEPASPGYNVYSMEVEDPPQTFYLNRSNAGSTGSPYIYPIDYTATVQIRGGSKVILRADNIDGSQISNRARVIVPDVDPDPAPFNGQFIQVDIVSITAV